MKRLRWDKFKKRLLLKLKRLPLGNYALVFEDTINGCILHEYVAPFRPWERWELEITYGVFRMQVREMLE